MIYKTSAVCLLLLGYMIFFYLQNPHIPHRLTKLFKLILIDAVLTAVLDLATLYLVNHRESVGAGTNLACHILYLLTILIFIFALYLYLIGCLENHIKVSARMQILHWIPFILSFVGILVLPISYVQGEVTAYSFGHKVYALYFSIIVYNIAILVFCVRYWRYMGREKRMALIMSFPMFFVSSAMQILMPETLLTVPCITLVTLGLMLSSENVERYLDKQSGLFNQYAFSRMLKDYRMSDTEVYVGVLCFCQKESSMDWTVNEWVLNRICHWIRANHQVGYRISENGVVLFFTTKETAGATMNAVKGCLLESVGKDELDVECRVLYAQNDHQKRNCIKDILDFCDEVSSKFAYIDGLTHIYNRNALSRDMERIGRSTDQYYFIADMNNFKMVNDTMGHSIGDTMLQSFAAVLTECAGRDGRVYRRGGDEFCVIYDKSAEELLQKLEQKCAQVNQTESITLSYAIGYCRMDDPDYCNIADNMMYERKRAMKSAHKKACAERREYER